MKVFVTQTTCVKRFWGNNNFNIRFVPFSW